MPLEVSQVRALVEAHMPRMVQQFQLNDWWIYTKYEQLSDVDWRGQVDLGQADYKRATIRFNVLFLDSDEDVLRVLRHELLHLLLAPFEIYDDVVYQYVHEDAVATKVRSRMRTHALEMIVGNLERALDYGLELPMVPQALKRPQSTKKQDRGSTPQP